MNSQDVRSQEFKVTIGKTLERIEYPVHASSPAGSVAGALVLPFSVDQIEQALQNFRQGIPRYRRRRMRGGAQFDELSPEGFGSALFRALFRNEVLALYREGLSMAGKPGVADRMPVKLNIIAQELARLPWELLYDPEREEFLSFGKDMPVIRFVDKEPRPSTFDPPLRVLLVSANPADTALLDLDRERKAIVEALDTLKREDKVRIGHLFGATIRELRSKVREYEPHLVHFMGHGQVNRLLLEGRKGEEESLSESSLGIILRNASSLRMVVLNACETARPDDSELRLGLAHGLARRRVPAIVAMQFEISDEAACEFAGELYRVLAEGLGVDEAVLWGRIAVQNRFVDDIEWVTPVLYMQAREGRIFDDLLRAPETEVRVDELSATRKERVEVLQKLLQIHERNLWRLREQKAKHGVMVPLILENSIDEEQAAIKQIWEELKQLEVGKEAVEPQEQPVIEIPHAYQEDATVDVKRRLADIGVTELDAYSPYEIGLGQLLNQMERNRPRYSEALVYQQRLIENIKRSRRYGDTAALKAERSGIIDRLNALTLSALDIPFSELCISVTPTSREPPQPLTLDSRLLEQVQTYYEQGLEHFDKSEWARALTFLENVQRLALGYKDAQRLIRTAREELTKQAAERRTQEKLAALYRQALMHCDAKHWQAAVDLFEEILRIDPSYEDAEVQAEKARQAHARQLAEEGTRSQLEALHKRAQERLAAEEWGQAVWLLEQVISIDRDYADALAQLDEAQRQKQLAELYIKGEKAFVAQDWEQAVANLGAAFATDKSYRDVEAKLEQARRQQRWDALYQEGLEYLEAERWGEAVEALREVQPDRKRRKDAKTAQLYAEGRQFAAQEKWDQAEARFEEVIEDNPQYWDAPKQLHEIRRQKRLHDLYTEGLKQAKAQEWRQAIRAFERVAREAPDYCDVQSRLALARKEAELAERYASGKRFFDLGRWDEAIQDFQVIVQVRLDYPNAQRMLEKAIREQELANLYAEGMRCLDQGQWQEAIDAFEKVAHIVPDYRDAAKQLDNAQKKKLLISAYEQGKACYEREDWTGAIRYLEQVMNYEEEGYRDAAVLLAKARRQERLAQFYQRGIDYLSMQDWDKALSSLEQVVELDQNYKDAATLLEEAQRQKWLADTYVEAKKLMEEEQWEDAVTHLRQVLKKDPHYPEAPALLAEAQRQDWLAILYTAGNQAYEEGRWTEAIGKYQQIMADDAKYRDIEEKLSEAHRQKELEEDYEQGMTCFGRGDWEEAISALEAVVEKDPNYKDAFVKLSEARRQQTLASHYAEGERCMAEERWDQAIAAFEKVVSIDPKYRDVEGRLDEADRQKTLAELYVAGEKHLASREWEQAIECFRRVQEIDEGYKGASEKLKKAEHERNLESLHGQGMRFFNASKWSEALESWGRLLALEPDYRDVADMVREAKWQQQLAELYKKGKEAFEKGLWLDAIESWEHLADLQSDYRDVKVRLIDAEQKWQEYMSDLRRQADELKTQGQNKQALKILKQLKTEVQRRGLRKS